MAVSYTCRQKRLNGYALSAQISALGSTRSIETGAEPICCWTGYPQASTQVKRVIIDGKPLS